MSTCNLLLASEGETIDVRISPGFVFWGFDDTAPTIRVLYAEGETLSLAADEAVIGLALGSLELV